MVSAGEVALDHANHWFRDFRFWNDDYVVCALHCLSDTPPNISTYSLPIMLYIVDSFTFAASATAASSVSFLSFCRRDSLLTTYPRCSGPYLASHSLYSAKTCSTPSVLVLETRY